ncbi:hypothetical protein MFLAVUS_010440 [Mucor flavus]|uniref:Uncharacterized protein n=1 Tax=Mucor flavus TaxID=439312 RepID=A0ABP9ZCP6_9FUNG
MDSADDLLAIDCPLLFADNNPKFQYVRKQERHQFFTGNLNQFFHLLNESGTFNEHVQSDQKAFELYRISFSYFVQRLTYREKELTKQDKELGKQQLKEKIDIYLPKVICFVVKMSCQSFLRKKSVNFGLAGDYNGISVHCLPRPCCKNRMFSYDVKLA